MKFDFKKLPISKSNYGKKDIDLAIKENKTNKGLIEVAKKLVDK